jgi:hypothetical protein
LWHTGGGGEITETYFTIKGGKEKIRNIINYYVNAQKIGWLVEVLVKVNTKFLLFHTFFLNSFHFFPNEERNVLLKILRNCPLRQMRGNVELSKKGRNLSRSFIIVMIFKWRYINFLIRMKKQ